MWAEESNFYHIYPLGFCGAKDYNSFEGNIEHNLYKVENQIEHLKNMRIDAVYFGPLFESTKHGYDTADYYKIDSRLGTNDEFAELCKNLHYNGMRIVLDGVFNHVGRDFWAFQDVRQNKGHSSYVDWFYIKWDCNDSYNDGFQYQDWEGCNDLVKLNLKNNYVKEHIFNAIRFWIEKFDIDGLRLDVAYCLDKDFLKELHNFTKSLKLDFWLLGEVIHGDYSQYLNDNMLDSITNYECFKGLYSSFYYKNMFEIAHSIKRQNTLYKGKHLYSFLDNHDVSRISTNLKDKRDLKLIYSMLFTMSGIPSIYYQSEFGIDGDKNDGDKALRPQEKFIKYNDLTNHIKNLCEINKRFKVFSYGEYEEVKLENEFYCFARRLNEEKALCCFNVSDKEKNFNYDGLQICLPPKSEQIFVNNNCVSFEKG